PPKKVSYCNGNACNSCGKCHDWRQVNGEWIRAPDATCRHVGLVGGLSLTGRAVHYFLYVCNCP
ncbi:unnamed protein product, partial [Rotaria sp. Silwood2]